MENHAVLPDMRAIAAYVEILRSGSLTVTAEQLAIPKSTLSRRISQLEERLGQKLLRRESNRLIPTQAGQLFADYCQQFVSLAQQTQMAMEALQKEVSGEVNVIVHNAFSCRWLSELTTSLLTQYPQLQVKLQTGLSLPQASLGETVVLWLGPVHENGFRHESLGQLSQGLYCNPEYLKQAFPLTHPRELQKHTWVNLFSPPVDEMRLDHPEEKSYTLTTTPSRISTDQFAMQAESLIRGEGIGLYPDWLAELTIAHAPNALIRCLAPWHGPSLPVWLMYPYGHLSKRTRVFIEYLKSHLPDAWH